MFWLGVIVALCYVPGITGAYIATQWPVLAVVMSFGLLRSAPFTLLHLLGALFLLYAAVHAFFTPAPYDAVFGLWLVVIMALTVRFGSTMIDTRGLYAGLALGAAVSSAIAVAQYLGLQWPPMSSPAPAGLYVNSVQQGTILALLTVALVTERMWLWALPLLPGLVLAQSRGAWLALAVGLLGCRIRHIGVLGLVAAVGCAILSVTLSPSDQERMLIWNVAWHGLTWFGRGPGMFYAVTIWREGTAWFPGYVHNDALQLLFEYGVGAVLPVAVFGFVLSRTEAREWPVVLAFVAASCYTMPLYMPVTAFLALVAVGRVLRTHARVLASGGHRRQFGVSRRSGGSYQSGATVSVEPSY
jgi:hypothetical protein